MEYVYFLGHADRDDTAIKIGWTYDIARRIDQLQGPVPFKLTCIEYVECPDDNARQVEQAIHRHLKDRRIHREWFDIRKHEIFPAVLAVVEELGLGEIVSEDTGDTLPPPGREPYPTEIRKRDP